MFFITTDIFAEILGESILLLTGCLKHLSPASFDPQWIKGDTVPSCKGLIASIKNNYSVVENSFHSAITGEKKKYHILQPGDFIYWEIHDQKNSLQSHHKDPYQVLLTSSCTRSQTPRNGLLNSHGTPKESARS